MILPLTVKVHRQIIRFNDAPGPVLCKAQVSARADGGRKSVGRGSSFDSKNCCFNIAMPASRH
jgi:hypothetical protein